MSIICASLTSNLLGESVKSNRTLISYHELVYNLWSYKGYDIVINIYMFKLRAVFLKFWYKQFKVRQVYAILIKQILNRLTDVLTNSKL
jgi:hypothetical protein